MIHLNNGILQATVMRYGATLHSLIVPDKNGVPTDIVLGYDTVEEYKSNDGYVGALVGRYANRIGNSQFTLNGKLYHLDSNEGSNQLHSGASCFGFRTWDVLKSSENSVTLQVFSPDGDSGYPGNLTVQVTYTLNDRSLEIDYNASTDADTPCSLTSHAYFNLSGHDSGSLDGHSLRIDADTYTPVDAGLIPDGTVASVKDTPLDFTAMRGILSSASGRERSDPAPEYDHNYILRGWDRTLRTAAEAFSSLTGIRMTVKTTSPAIQFYDAIYLSNHKGKNGASYRPFSAFCLETQYCPDSPNHPNFPSAIITPSAPLKEKTVFQFSAE
ncbi:MAG: galactose mutarotase [Clostridiales bacterium]|nr:galactose mutarotase [Clostridiales bacterium]